MQRSLAVLLVGLSLMGCGTVVATQNMNAADREADRRYEGPYMGLVLDFEAIRGCLTRNGDYEPDESIRVLPILDFPFSFIADTLMLPYTLFPPYHAEAVGKGC